LLQWPTENNSTNLHLVIHLQHLAYCGAEIQRIPAKVTDNHTKFSVYPWRHFVFRCCLHIRDGSS